MDSFKTTGILNFIIQIQKKKKTNENAHKINWYLKAFGYKGLFFFLNIL